jgi:hypothetical protein
MLQFSCTSTALCNIATSTSSLSSKSVQIILVLMSYDYLYILKDGQLEAFCCQSDNCNLPVINFTNNHAVQHTFINKITISIILLISKLEF